MGSVREYLKRDGSKIFRAEVRIKGSKPQRASFTTRQEALAWAENKENYLRGSVDEKVKKQLVPRHNWSYSQLLALYELPFNDLLHTAHRSFRVFHNPNQIQRCYLINIKEGGCSEDCAFCAQSAHFKTAVKAKPLISIEEALSAAKKAIARGASRVCLGAAWRQVRTSSQFDRVLAMVKEISSQGIEVCCTLGMLQPSHLEQLKEAGLFAYNHNLETSRRNYEKIVTTHTFDDRLSTVKEVANCGISVCSGGIFGMGETLEDRLELIRELASLRPHPDSVPLNILEPICGTPKEKSEPLSVIEFVRLIAITRLAMPKAMIRLSAGRRLLSSAEQALCFFAGANSIFVSDKMLTVDNCSKESDDKLFSVLGLEDKPSSSRSNQKSVLPPREERFIRDRLAEDRNKGCYRSLSYKKADLVDFASNDYLGIASCPQTAQDVEKEYARLAFVDGIRPRLGATGSRLLTGNHPYLEELEEQIASFHCAQAALLFNSGYSANTGLLSCLGGEEDAVLLDSQVHASTWDGARLSRAKSYLFRHNDLESLETQLKRARSSKKELFICVESLYSMSGDLAPLEEICQLARRYSAWVIVDEAHATGMLGREGRGLVEALQDRSSVIATIYTFGKAIGAHGAAITGSCQLKEYLVNRCRTFIYTTAFPLHSLVALRTIYQKLPEWEDRRQKLKELIFYFCQQVAISGLPIMTSKTPIQSLSICDSYQALALSRRLQEQAGLDVRAIRSPTVRPGEERLRICLHSFNSSSEIDLLIDALSAERLDRASVGF